MKVRLLQHAKKRIRQYRMSEVSPVPKQTRRKPLKKLLILLAHNIDRNTNQSTGAFFTAASLKRCCHSGGCFSNRQKIHSACTRRVIKTHARESRYSFGLASCGDQDASSLFCEYTQQTGHKKLFFQHSIGASYIDNGITNISERVLLKCREWEYDWCRAQIEPFFARTLLWKHDQTGKHPR